MTTEVVELIGNPRLGSRTRAVADGLTAAVLPRLADRGVVLTGVTALELGELVRVSFGAALPAAPPPLDPVAVVRGARLLIVATPTYKGTYTGLLKVFLDQFQRDDLAEVVAVGVAVAAGEEHRRSVGAQTQALLVALGTHAPAEPYTLLESEVGGGQEARWVEEHLDELASALVKLGPRA